MNIAVDMTRPGVFLFVCEHIEKYCLSELVQDRLIILWN